VLGDQPTSAPTQARIAEVVIQPNSTQSIVVNVQTPGASTSASVTVPPGVCSSACVVRIEAVTSATTATTVDPIATAPAGLQPVTGTSNLIITLNGQGGPLAAPVTTRAERACHVN
jgi:hypothetical protein